MKLNLLRRQAEKTDPGRLSHIIIFGIAAAAPLVAIWLMQLRNAPLEATLTVWVASYLGLGALAALIRWCAHYPKNRWWDGLGKAIGFAAALGGLVGYFLVDAVSRITASH